jgi:DNA-binding CsgD family transcriptional regulator
MIKEVRMADRPAFDVFVGRQRELGELRAALEDALSGRGRLVMLVGEPGIGKTRTAEELAALAQQRGAQVLWGRCYEEQGVPPYWPWVQVIRSCVEARHPETLRTEMGPGATDIAEVVSEVRGKLPDLKPPPALEAEQARFRLFDSITTFLKGAAKTQPLMLLLEDLHWADKPSLLLLEFLARELAGSRLLVVATYRDVELSRRHPLSETLGGLARERLFQRVLLRGLGRKEVGQFIEATAGIQPPPRLVEAVHTQTEGNPFFMVQVIRLLEQEGELTAGQLGEHPSWHLRIPEGVREVIGRRLNRLSETCNRTLSMASIIGREFTFDQLARLVDGLSTSHALEPSGSLEGKLREGSGQGLADDRLLEVLEQALAARVIEEVPGSAGRYQFAHALIQETLTEELSATRRVRLHAHIAEALEGLYGGEAEVHAAELAHHFAAAKALLGSEKLVKYSLLAGERALSAYAYEEALTHFQRGLTAKGVALTGTEPAKDAETAALLFGLGRAQAATLERYQLREAVARLGQAFDYYAAVGDVPHAVAVAQHSIFTTAGYYTGMAHLGARALALVPPDSLEAGHLLCTYGRELGMQEGDYRGAQEAFRKALAIAQGEQDPTLEGRTLAYACQVDHHHRRFQEGVDKGLRAIEQASWANDLYAQVEAHTWTTYALLDLGELERARPLAAAGLALAERLRDRNRLVRGLTINQSLSELMGDWEAARDLSDRALAIAPRVAAVLGHRALLEYQVGDFGQGQAYLERLVEAMPMIVPGPNMEYAMPAVTIPMAARIAGVARHLDVAEAAAKAVLSSPSATPMYTNYARTGLALLAALRSDTAAAGEQYTALKQLPSKINPHIAMSSDRLLALLTQTMGQLDQAAEHFEDALALCRKAGCRPELAWSCCNYADALLQRNNLGDRQRAMALLEESLAIARELGMRPLMERVLTRRERVESQPDTPPSYPNGLSQREVEVLRLIALGRSNREIAEELFISLRTVANHVSNLLNKTNTANRTEAATYASHHGLV